jgi:hypothetical protein
LKVYRFSSLLLPCHPHSAKQHAAHSSCIITGINHPLVVLVVMLHLLVLCVRMRTQAG